MAGRSGKGQRRSTTVSHPCAHAAAGIDTGCHPYTDAAGSIDADSAADRAHADGCGHAGRDTHTGTCPPPYGDTHIVTHSCCYSSPYSDIRAGADSDSVARADGGGDGDADYCADGYACSHTHADGGAHQHSDPDPCGHSTSGASGHSNAGPGAGEQPASFCPSS